MGNTPLFSPEHCCFSRRQDKETGILKSLHSYFSDLVVGSRCDVPGSDLVGGSKCDVLGVLIWWVVSGDCPG